MASFHCVWVGQTCWWENYAQKFLGIYARFLSSAKHSIWPISPARTQFAPSPACSMLGDKDCVFVSVEVAHVEMNEDFRPTANKLYGHIVAQFFICSTRFWLLFSCCLTFWMVSKLAHILSLGFSFIYAKFTKSKKLLNKQFAHGKTFKFLLARRQLIHWDSVYHSFSLVTTKNTRL